MPEPLLYEQQLDIDGEPVEVIRVELKEPIDGVPRLRCEITDNAGGPDPAQIIGKKLELTLRNQDADHKFVGIIVEAENTTLLGDEAEGTLLIAEPRLFHLEHRTASRIFQNEKVDAIVKKVLADAGIPESDQQWQLEGDYPEREYTTQYRETDFAFIRRLLAEEGIAFSVDGSSGTDIVVFFDGDLGDLKSKELTFRPGDGMVGQRDAISRIDHEEHTVSGKVHLRDYDFERPRMKLDSVVTAEESDTSLEVYVYPGRYKEPSVGDRYAQVLLDSIRSRRETIRGVTSAIEMQVGRTFELVEHPYEPLNREYMILELTVYHEARKPRGSAGGKTKRPPGSRIEFLAIPTEKTTYRPARIPRAVASPGAQIAEITGPSGQEIHTEGHGRVKVYFPWDREGKPDETSSLWIRTCQLPLGGSMFTPRVGWESYLNFIDGDPDKPFVFGRMYNVEKPPPYALPKNKARSAIQTATTPGGGSSNEIRLADDKGSEQMFMNASKDTTIAIGNNTTEAIGNNETRTIGANQSVSVTDSVSSRVGADQSLSVGGNQTDNVGTYMVDDIGGDHKHTIGGNRDLKAGGDHKRTVSGASTLTIGGMQIDLVAGSVDEETLAHMKDKVGAALVELTPSDRTITVTGDRTESAGAAKVIVSLGGRAVTIGGDLKQKVAGAILTKIKGDRADSTGGTFLEVAGGAEIIKATNVVYKADSVLSVIMGASTITLTPASVSIAGIKITFDGDCSEMAALTVDNI